MDADDQLAERPISSDQFIPCVAVQTKSGQVLPIPKDADANRLASRLIAAELRDFCRSNLEKLKELKVPIGGKELKALTDSFATVEEIARFANEPGLGLEDASAVGKAADAVGKVADALRNSVSDDKMKKIRELGRKGVEENNVIDLAQ